MSKKLKTIISISLVILAAVIAKILVATAPEAQKQRPPKMAPLVTVQKLKAADEVVTLSLTGTVMPAEEVKLRARVSGEVVSMVPDFIDGGLLEKGVAAVQIDPVDYELALADAESKLESARFAYKQELGRQDVAKREWALLKADDATEFEEELALRKPHLAASKAALKAAEAAFEKATLNLERTQVRMPFNAVVVDRNVNVGSQASLQDVLATVAGTDAVWVQVSIPVDRLGWVKIPGSSVQVVSGSGAVREGTVIRLLANLEEKGRMARLLVEVKDQLCIQPENVGRKPLLIGEYVRAEIAGRELESVYAIPRNALRENSHVWIATKENKLDLREIEVLWRDADQVIIRNGLADGEQLITSDLTAPIHGMDINPGHGKQPANKE